MSGNADVGTWKTLLLASMPIEGSEKKGKEA